MPQVSLVVTSINPPNQILHALAEGSTKAGIEFIVAGDAKSPSDFALGGCRFLGLAAQLASGFQLAAIAPTGHYSRKNIGYLDAIARGARLILETDDDNLPTPAFFAERHRRIRVAALARPGWINVYRYFSETNIWPRGLPLDAIHDDIPEYDSLEVHDLDSPIQQGLADENPDVDAVFRLVQPLPQRFRTDRSVALGPRTWCPFNSQNTAWWSDAFPLLYLPSYCSFRMTDIWRSLVAQRIAGENDWWILFHGPTVRQERNAHDLMQDFADEVPGYLNNRRIARALDTLALPAGRNCLGENLYRCYEALVALGVIDRAELTLIDAWRADLASVERRASDPVCG
jgi:hypothetical protein